MCYLSQKIFGTRPSAMHGGGWMHTKYAMRSLLYWFVKWFMNDCAVGTALIALGYVLGFASCWLVKLF